MFSSRKWLTRFTAVVLSTSLSATVGAAVAAASTPRSASAIRGVTAWLPYWSISAALTSTLDHAGEISNASPYWYSMAGASGVRLEPGAGDPAVVSELLAKGVRVMPMVTEDAQMPGFARILRSAGLRQEMVAALVGIADRPGYAGLDLDFEDLALDRAHDLALSEQVAVAYPKLVAEVCAALRAIERRCEVTVMARTGPAPSAWTRGRLATWVYDYGALARAADGVQIMAYDDHTAPGAIGPVAPIAWVRQVVSYASGQMPPDRAVLGLAAYGYDWSAGAGTSVTAAQAIGLAQSLRVPIRWSPAQEEDTFHYKSDGQRHTVWFENGTADDDRAKLAADAGFSGVAIWAAGDEDPTLWSLLGTE